VDDIAVGIINWNSGKWLKECIESLLVTSEVAEIAVVDNASKDDSLALAGGFENRVRFVRNHENIGFAAGVNQAFGSTSAPYVLVLNPDIGVLPGVVHRMRQFLEQQPKAAAVGGHVGDAYLPRQLPTMRSLICENLGLSKPSTAPSSQKPYEVEQPAAAALMIRRSAYQEVGGFDDRFYPAWYEDVDFCKQLRTAGWKIFFDPSAKFMHEGGYSARALGTAAFAEAYYRNQLRYVRKHMGAIAGIAVRCSMVAGMAARGIAAPSNAAAYWAVLVGALGKW
jgi:GT2 family glycosyltransferase